MRIFSYLCGGEMGVSVRSVGNGDRVTVFSLVYIFTPTKRHDCNIGKVYIAKLNALILHHL